MPPDGSTTTIVPNRVLGDLLTVMTEYDCRSVAEAVAVDATVAFEQDEAQLARLLANRHAD